MHKSVTGLRFRRELVEELGSVYALRNYMRSVVLAAIALVLAVIVNVVTGYNRGRIQSSSPTLRILGSRGCRIAKCLSSTRAVIRM